MKRTIGLSLSAFLLVLTAGSVYASNENQGISDLRAQKTTESSYCNPGLHHCEAPFTIGRDNMAKPDGSDNNYCNPGSHRCEAPFSTNPDNISNQYEKDKKYCNPNSRKCNAPFTIGNDHINR
ncbi:hypothetical protein ACVAAS_003607 [Enterobacter roggenkampii]